MYIDPDLIAVSKCGKYVYPVDSISGAKTFAPIEYFKKNVETKYGGSIEKFVKEYTTRETKKYLKEGWSPEGIKNLRKTRMHLRKNVGPDYLLMLYLLKLLLMKMVFKKK
jgi:hypothetical protein